MNTSQPIIDPRLHDAVVFVVPQSDSAAELMSRLQEAGIAATEADPGTHDASALRELARSLNTRAERCVVIDTAPDGITAARNGGFAMVVAIGSAEHADDLLQCGADAVVDDLSHIEVRTGDRPMSQIPNAIERYDEVSAAIGDHRPAVCLDFDGTLSTIVPDPNSARLVDGAADALARLAQRCPVAILSGRDLADIRDRVGVPYLWYAGSHGFESVAPEGGYRQNDDAAAAVPVLEKAADELRRKLAGIDGSRVEHKRFAVAVHYRDVADDDIGKVVASTHQVGRQAHLRITNGRKIVELRPDVDWNKGTTLMWIRDQISTQGAGPVLPLFIGDDLTDEDAFDAVKRDGVGILVRHTEDGDRRSAAQFTLESPDQVGEFLDRLADDLATSS